MKKYNRVLFTLMCVMMLASACTNTASEGRTTPAVTAGNETVATALPLPIEADATEGVSQISYNEGFSPPPYMFFEQPGINLLTIEEEDGNHKIDAYYPETESEPVNESISHMILSDIAGFKETNEKGAMYIRFKSYRYNEQMIGFSFDIFEYDSAKGLRVYKKTMTYDLMGGLAVPMSELFKENTNYLNVISEAATRQLMDMKHAFADGASADFDARVAKAVEPALSSFTLFNVDYEKLFVFFKIDNATDGAYAEVSIPLSDLKESWNGDNYLLKYFQGNKGEVAITMPSEPKEKYIAITFDDGPHEKNTVKLLDALAERDVKATFFVLGHRISSAKDIIKRMHDEGHSVGNHSYNHKELTKLKKDGIYYQIDETNSLLKEITGEMPTLIRPPYGSKNDTVKAICTERGLSIILWSVDPEDWKYKNAKTICDNIVNGTKNGSIILVHDIYEESVDGAVMAIDKLLAQGYHFVTVDELIGMSENPLEPGGIYGSVKVFK